MIRFRTKTFIVREDQGAVKYDDQRRVTGPESASNLLREIYKDLDCHQEHFTLLAIDVKSRIIGYKVLHSGGMVSCHVDPKILFHSAIVLGAYGIIVAHNHPSGDCSPSADDLILIDKIKQGCQTLDINFIDSIILGTGDRYSSMIQ